MVDLEVPISETLRIIFSGMLYESDSLINPWWTALGVYMGICWRVFFFVKRNHQECHHFFVKRHPYQRIKVWANDT